MRQKGGKEVTAWAVEGDLDADAIVSNTFELEWPPARVGCRRSRGRPGGWFGLDGEREAQPAQGAFLDRLRDLLA